jgi:exopolyphosphatase/guanosine-5'-triphosphate,3'-diphosphate pyrophosphatase
MGVRYRLILELAAILHDIGTYLKPSGHHKHGYYLVLNSEIFGISKGDLAVIANIVRYHRKAQPSTGHENFISLRREQRVSVLKLSAILRIADALDRGHSQRVRNVQAEIQGSDLALRCKAVGDLSVERHGMPSKADMFEEVFGLNVILTEA